jgi:hypothetical protein
MTLTLEGDNAALHYGELALTLPMQALPQAGFAPILGKVLLALSQQGLSYTRSAGGWMLKGTAGELRYTARLNNDGALCALTVPEVGMRVVLA